MTITNISVFRSTDQGAVSGVNGRCSGTAGDGIALLNQLLLTGYNSQTVTPANLTQTGGLATLVLTGHGFSQYQRLMITGATQAGYNLDAIYPTIVDPNTITFAVAGGTVSPATTSGTITIKVAPAGGASPWTSPFTGTNKAVYRPPGGNRYFLDIDDTGTNTFQARTYEAMTAVGTGTNPFPTTAQVAAGSTYVSKSNAASTLARAWVAIVTDRMLHLSIDCAGGGNNPTVDGKLSFYDCISLAKSGDLYATGFQYDASSAGGGNGSSTFSGGSTSAQQQCYMARSYTQLGTSIQFGKTPADGRISSSSVSGGSGQLTYPHPPDGGLYLCQLAVNEGSAVTRGVIPGLWHIMHSKPATHGDIVPGSGTLAGKVFMFVNTYNTAQICYEISNTIPTT